MVQLTQLTKLDYLPTFTSPNMQLCLWNDHIPWVSENIQASALKPGMPQSNCRNLAEPLFAKINWSSSGKKNMLLPCCDILACFVFYAPWLQIWFIYTFELENPDGRAVFNALTQPTQFFFCSLLNRGSGQAAIFLVEPFTHRQDL